VNGLTPVVEEEKGPEVLGGRQEDEEVPDGVGVAPDVELVGHPALGDLEDVEDESKEVSSAHEEEDDEVRAEGEVVVFFRGQHDHAEDEYGGDEIGDAQEAVHKSLEGGVRRMVDPVGHGDCERAETADKDEADGQPEAYPVAVKIVEEGGEGGAEVEEGNASVVKLVEDLADGGVDWVEKVVDGAKPRQLMAPAMNMKRG